MADNSKTIQLGEWLPDFPETNNPGVNVATNVVPRGPNYAPVKDLVSSSDALATRCIGSYTHNDPDGSTVTFSGTQTGLFKLVGSSWTDVTRTSGAYSAANDARWVFVSFGNRVLATNGTDNIQSFLVGTDTEFSDLGGSSPICKSLWTVAGFVVAGNLSDGSNKTAWSALEDPTDWVSSATTLAGAQELLQGAGGAISAGIGYQNSAIIIQDNAIQRMEFVGPPAIFTFELIENNRGSRMPGSIASDGDRIFYMSDTGPYVFNVASSIAIGSKSGLGSRVDQYWQDNYNSGLPHRVYATIDPLRKLVMTSFASNDSSDNPDKILVYAWSDDRFTLVEKDHELIFNSLSAGQTLEQIGATYASLEVVPFSLDSRLWQGGAPLFGAFDTDHKLAYFTGSNLTATIETTEVRLNPNGSATLVGVTPIVDGTCTVTVKDRFLLTDSTTSSSATSVQSETGSSPFVIDSRYFRASLSITGSWTLAQGVQFRSEPSGEL